MHDVSFEVREGEILGIAGVQGNGQTELAEALTGLRATKSGHVTLAGKDVTGKTPRPIIEAGLAHIPEDRQRHGLVLGYSVADNMVLCNYYLPPFAKGMVLQQEAVDANARKLIEEYDVRTPSPFVPTAKLSGGNQQKVIVARELSRDVKLLIASQPTRGLDVGSIEYIHKEIIAMRDRGLGVLLISAELDEIMALSDRIAVMYRGQIVTTVDAKDATREATRVVDGWFTRLTKNQRLQTGAAMAPVLIHHFGGALKNRTFSPACDTIRLVFFTFVRRKKECQKPPGSFLFFWPLCLEFPLAIYPQTPPQLQRRAQMPS